MFLFPIYAPICWLYTGYRQIRLSKNETVDPLSQGGPKGNMIFSHVFSMFWGRGASYETRDDAGKEWRNLPADSVVARSFLRQKDESELRQMLLENSVYQRNSVSKKYKVPFKYFAQKKKRRIRKKKGRNKKKKELKFSVTYLWAKWFAPPVLPPPSHLKSWPWTRDHDHGASAIQYYNSLGKS